MKKILRIAKGIIGYILAIVLTIVFALFLNANVGWYMLTALTLAPVLSVFFAWLTRKTVSINVDIDESILEKGDKVSLKVALNNHFLFPTTPIEIKLLNAPGLSNEKNSVIVNVLPFQKKEIQVDFTASICGKSKVGIEAITIIDFLGIFRFNKKINCDEFLAECRVLPKINEISSKDDRILKVMQDSLMWDDGEDTREKQTVGFGGFPGYDKREYVPGDPIKRINWKQSAKAGKLYVRLDEEVNATSVNVVLDGYFDTRNVIDPYVIAEDAIENTLGIVMTMARSGYKVNLFVKTGEFFETFFVEDEKDVENLRYVLAGYEFNTSSQNRFPEAEILNNRAFVLSTPNILSSIPDNPKISVFSAFVKQKKEVVVKDKKAALPKGKFFTRLGGAFILALVLSVVVFDAFQVSFVSVWTLLEMLVVGLIFGLCEFARRRKFFGFLAISLTVIGCLSLCGNLISPVNLFLEWFLSGGDSGGLNPGYLMVLLLFFTVFFGAVVYFYTQSTYRTSALMLVSMIAFLVHVKVMRDVKIGYAMVVVALNVLMYVLHNKKESHTKLNSRLALVLYMVMFTLLALAVPKDENTKYYYLFEEHFLNGNTELEIPSEYLDDDEISGNADNIQLLSNRKIYQIEVFGGGKLSYFRNNVYDVYDYSIDRWRGIESYSDRGRYLDKWENSTTDRDLSLEKLYEAILKTEEVKPGFLKKYGIEGLLEIEFTDSVFEATVSPWELNYRYYICPVRGRIKVVNEDKDNILVLGHDTYYLQNSKKQQEKVYNVEFYDEFETLENWKKLGLMNFDTETSINMLKEIELCLRDVDDELSDYAYEFYMATRNSVTYSNECKENNKLIPESVKNLALEITRDCTYDWEKAEALADYFSEGFYYNMYYKAPDDSVEYFLFEGKTGTCSDFASAYVLMARAVGLTARYVEGYVPQKLETMDEKVLYEVRARNAHAYPEVFIQNVGYVVYEPTQGDYRTYIQNGGNLQDDVGFVDFAVTLASRTIIIFTAVAVVILLVFFVVVVFGPSIKEKIYITKIKKKTANEAVILIYKRLLRKYLKKKIKNIETFTPEECALIFKEKTGFDISELTNLISKVAYESKDLSEDDKVIALEIYIKAKKMLRKTK